MTVPVKPRQSSDLCPATCLGMRKLFRALVCACTGVVLVACGPGVVGTGAPVASVSTLDPGNLCNAPFASVLPCGASSSGASAPLTATLSDAPADNQPADVRLRIDGNSVALQWRCGGLSFDGRWSVLSDGSLAFYGTFVNAAQPQGAPGILRLSLATDNNSTRLRVSLHDPFDVLLGGPWFLRNTTPSDTANCPV